ncbi:hypothetical protein AAVH_13905, partial [Aphelenchoides avenae]
MTRSDDELLNYEDDQAALAKKGLAAEAVTDATAQLADVTLETKPATKEVTMTDATLPGEANANLIKMLAEALGGNRVGNSLHNVKYLTGDEGPEQVRRWFSEFELITRGWSDEERRQALQVRVKGRAATAVQLMPRDLCDDYSKIKGELLLRLADDEPRRSANLTCLLSGCPRLPNETVEQFGARAQMLVRDALEPNCPLSQVDAIAKQCFISGLDDEQLLPSLISLRDHTEFR